MNETPVIPKPSRIANEEESLESRFKFKRVNEITGVFVLLVVSLLIAIVVWTGHSQRWFKSNVALRIALPEAGAAGIRQGSEVYFLGTLVGSVSDVIVDTTTGRMEAQANIRYDFFRFVRADSSAVVKKKFGVAGDSFFEIARGEGAALPEKNASIVCKDQFQSALESAIEEIRNQTMLVLKKIGAGLDTWTQLGADLRETRQRVDQLTAKLETITTGIAEGKGTVGKLLADPTLADDATNLMARANQTMIQLQSVVTNLDSAVKNVQAGTKRLPEITDAVANETKDLPGLVLQTQASMREMERLIEAMQRHWLLRRFVNQTNPPAVDSSSAFEDPKRSRSEPLRSK
jgi:phospholipid/cholesterol/gamma-HCH transport system substrate-binding protein